MVTMLSLLTVATVRVTPFLRGSGIVPADVWETALDAAERAVLFFAAATVDHPASTKLPAATIPTRWEIRQFI
jgi:hypothetical protein